MVLGLLVGIAAGLAIATVVVVGFSDTTLSEFVGKLGTVKFMEAAGAGLLALVAFAVGMAILVPVHEAGHLIAGLATGYKFVSFRIFNFTIIRIGDNLRVKKFGVAGTGGQCLLLPPELPVEKVPTAWYNMGGVLANIIVLLLLLPLVFIKGYPYLSVAAWVVILADVILIVFNGIPMKITGSGNDAYNALSMRKNTWAKIGLTNALKSNAQIQMGVRPKDMPDEWFVVPEQINYKNPLEVSIPMMAASRLVDQLEFAKAEKAFETLYEHKREIIGLYLKEIECELIFLRLMAGDIDGARKLLTPALRKYIEAYRNTMSSKERILFAITLIMEGDPDRATEIYNNLDRRQTDYLLQGEVRSDLAIMDTILNNPGIYD